MLSQPDETGARQRLWTAGGLLFVAASAGACAAGLFIEKFLAQQAFEALPHRPILQLVFACQAIFVLLFGPTAWAAIQKPTTEATESAEKGKTEEQAKGIEALEDEKTAMTGQTVGQAGLPAALPLRRAGLLAALPVGRAGLPAGLPLESASVPVPSSLGGILQRLGLFSLRTVLSLAVCSPIYLVAAWLSDATAVDVFRSLLYLLCLVAAAGGLSLWVDRRGVYAAVQMLLALLVLGVPCAWYILAESGLGDWSIINSFSPLVQAWRAGDSRQLLLAIGWLLPGAIFAAFGLFMACAAWVCDPAS